MGVQQTASLMIAAAAKFMQMMGSFYTGGWGRWALGAEVPGIQVPGRSEHREEEVLIAWCGRRMSDAKDSICGRNTNLKSEPRCLHFMGQATECEMISFRSLRAS